MHVLSTSVLLEGDQLGKTNLTDHSEVAALLNGK